MARGYDGLWLAYRCASSREGRVVSLSAYDLPHWELCETSEFAEVR